MGEESESEVGFLIWSIFGPLGAGMGGIWKKQASVSQFFRKIFHCKSEKFLYGRVADTCGHALYEADF